LIIQQEKHYINDVVLFLILNGIYFYQLICEKEINLTTNKLSNTAIGLNGSHLIFAILKNTNPLLNKVYK